MLQHRIHSNIATSESCSLGMPEAVLLPPHGQPPGRQLPPYRSIPPAKPVPLRPAFTPSSAAPQNFPPIHTIPYPQ